MSLAVLGQDVGLGVVEVRLHVDSWIGLCHGETGWTEVYVVCLCAGLQKDSGGSDGAEI